MGETTVPDGDARYRAIFEGASIGIALLDLSGRCSEANSALMAMLGRTEDELSGTVFGEPAQSDDAEDTGPYRELLAGRRDRYQVEKCYVRKDGGRIWAYVTLALVRDDAGRPRSAVAMLEDITERKLLQDALTRRSRYDTMTGLPNQALFMERLADALARARQQGRGLAVFLLDVDRFDVIKDSLGHGASDALIAAVGRRLATRLREGDTVAHLSSDRFAVLLEDIADPSNAVRAAERILVRLRRPFTLEGRDADVRRARHGEPRRPFTLEGREVFVTASIGIAVRIPSAARTRADDLVHQADVALYHAKAAGKDRAVLFDHGMHGHPVARLQLVADLHRAVERAQFQVHYQPEVDLRTGAIVGMEALVRWEHPSHGLMSPAEFISLAEDSGLILPIGRWVLETACRQARAWQEQYPSDLPRTLSVNLSPRQLGQPDLAEQVSAVLGKTGLSPTCLRLEITETVLLDNKPTTEGLLRGLRALGVQLAIDDFGTGYSSLSYLRRFAVDVLKIDRSFVAQIGHDEATTAIVRAVAMLAHDLGLKVTAEGIETPEHWAYVRAIGCDYGQGYHFARPMPAEEMGRFLAGRAKRRRGDRDTATAGPNGAAPAPADLAAGPGHDSAPADGTTSVG